jgi:hypothetical protein
MKVFLVAGARPNFMKIAPIYRASLATRLSSWRRFQHPCSADREDHGGFRGDLRERKKTRKMMEHFQIRFSENIKLFFTLPSIPSRQGRGSKGEVKEK